MAIFHGLSLRFCQFVIFLCYPANIFILSPKMEAVLYVANSYIALLVINQTYCTSPTLLRLASTSIEMPSD